MQRHRPRQHHALDVAPQALEVVSALPMVHAHDVLVDDRSVVERLCDVVRGRADQLDAPLARAGGAKNDFVPRVRAFMGIVTYAYSAAQ